MEKISVIIPTYNREKTIKKALESVIQQTYSDLEIIVVDDNSSDNTIKEVKAIDDNRIKIIKNSCNRGACFSRNIGVEYSQGKYIAFQDSDDIWELDKLSKQLALLKEKKFDVVSCYIKQIYSDSKEKRFPQDIKSYYEDSSNIFYENYFSTQTIIGKKECFIKEKFDEKFPRFQDWDLMIRMSNKYNVGFLEEELVKAFIQIDSISASHQKAIDGYQLLLNKYKLHNSIKSLYNRRIGICKVLDGRKDYYFNFKNAYKYNKSLMNFINRVLGYKVFNKVLICMHKLNKRRQ